jgi:type IV pilus assembly protein PilO
MDAFFDKFAKVPMLQKILGLLVVCLAIIVIFYMFVLTPKQDEQAEIRNTIAAAQTDLANKRKTVGDLTQYKREVEKLNQDLQKALKLLPNSAEIPSLLQKISALAQKSGLEIVSFQPNPQISLDFYAKVPVSLSIRGSYNEITNFFDAVGKLSRIVNISNFSFSMPKESDSKVKIEGSKKVLAATCVATTFRFIESAPPAAEKAQP